MEFVWAVSKRGDTTGGGTFISCFVRVPSVATVQCVEVGKDNVLIYQVKGQTMGG